MLISKRKNESISVRDGISITIVDIKDRKVKLVINAPEYISVLRGEVYEIIKREEADKKETNPGNLETNVQFGTSQNNPREHNKYLDTNYGVLF